MLPLEELEDPARGWVAEDGALTVEVLFEPTRAAVRACSCRRDVAQCMRCTPAQVHAAGAY